MREAVFGQANAPALSAVCAEEHKKAQEGCCDPLFGIRCEPDNLVGQTRRGGLEERPQRGRQAYERRGRY
jgi:hypothetical protein